MTNDSTRAERAFATVVGALSAEVGDKLSPAWTSWFRLFVGVVRLDGSGPDAHAEGELVANGCEVGGTLAARRAPFIGLVIALIAGPAAIGC